MEESSIDFIATLVVHLATAHLILPKQMNKLILARLGPERIDLANHKATVLRNILFWSEHGWLSSWGINSSAMGKMAATFTDDILERILLNENIRIPIQCSMKFVPKCPIDNLPALVLIMAWRRIGDKPLSELILTSSPTHICGTRVGGMNYI